MRIVGLLMAALLLTPVPAPAAELVMFESDLCEWCDVWNEDVGGVYAKTREGERAPLRRVDIDDPRPRDLAELRGIVYTPTFVLVDGGKEVGRITGYPGESHFWGLLGQLLTKLPQRVGACPQGEYAASAAKKKENSPC